jgi:hypothetical protein
VTDIQPGAGLAWENKVVLMLVQALLGLVSREIGGVAIEFDGDSVTVHFAVLEQSEALAEALDDVIGDLEGLLWPVTPDVASRAYVGPPNDGSWEGRQHRLVFLAKL